MKVDKLDVHSGGNGLKCLRIAALVNALFAKMLSIMALKLKERM
jgi:hypothetical protein